MKIVWLVLFLHLALGINAGTIPGASFSLSLESIDNLLKSVIPKLINLQLNPQHILVDYLQIPTPGGPVVFKNIHMGDYIDFSKTTMSAMWAGDNQVYFYMINATLQFNTEYEMFQFKLLKGNAQLRIQEYSILTKITYIDRGDTWSIEIIQVTPAKIVDIDLNMHNPILDFIYQIIKSKLIEEIQNALGNYVFPRWETLIQQFIDKYNDPHKGAVYFDSDYFISLNILEKPVFDRSNDYVEVQLNGLTYKAQDRTTIATNDLEHAYRDVNGREAQINLSDNALESFTPYLLSQIPNSMRVPDDDQKFKSFFQGLLPTLVGHFGINATYALNIFYSIQNPQYVISNGTLIMQDNSIGIELLASNSTTTDFNVARFNFLMINSATGSISDFVADSEIKIVEIEPESFHSISNIGDLGVSDDVLEERIFFLMEYLMEQSTNVINNYDLTRIVPDKFEFLLDCIADVTLVLNKDEHFVHIGLNST